MLGDVESLMAKRLVVVRVIPKVRRDWAICAREMVSFYIGAELINIAG